MRLYLTRTTWDYMLLEISNERVSVSLDRLSPREANIDGNQEQNQLALALVMIK